MSELCYGWIRNGSKSKIRTGSEVTHLANVIKNILSSSQRYTENGIRAKNVIVYKGKIIYILCINEKGSMWAPYPLIESLCQKDNFWLLLGRGDTKDDEKDRDLSGEMWILNPEQTKDIIYRGTDKVQLYYNPGNYTGPYYSLPLNLLKRTQSQVWVKFQSRKELQDKLYSILGEPNEMSIEG